VCPGFTLQNGISVKRSWAYPWNFVDKVGELQKLARKKL
jgi:hypothetical protein